MAGHSKWSNIKYKKAISDNKKSKTWTKLIKDIEIAIRIGGENLNYNPRLRLAINKANSANIPKNNILRVINNNHDILKKYEKIEYNGYTKDGIALIIEALTNNKIRTTSSIKYIFSKHNANLIPNGSLYFIFQNIFKIFIKNKIYNDTFIKTLLKFEEIELLQENNKCTLILCKNKNLQKIKKLIKIFEYKIDKIENIFKPNILIDVNEEKVKNFKRLFNDLKNLNDIKEIYSNYNEIRI